MTEVVLVRPDAPFLNVLVVVLEVVALLARGFIGSRLGEPASVEFVETGAVFAAFVVVVVVDEEEEEAGLRIDRERCVVDILTPLTLCLEMEMEWDVLVNVYCDGGDKGRLGYGYQHLSLQYYLRQVPLAGARRARSGLRTVSKVRVESSLQVADPRSCNADSGLGKAGTWTS